MNLTGGDAEPERVDAATVTANTFSTLGAAPMLGRTFTATEDVPNGPNVAVIGFGLWHRRFASDPSIVGKSILINGAPYEVVGVMPPDFVLPTDFQNTEPSEIWMPQQLDPASMDHGSHGLYAAGRLKPGATVRQAADELHAIAQAMTKEGLYPVQMQFDTVVLSLTDEVVGNVRRAIWLLFGAVAFLLLIACANVANLLLARAEARQREIAVRSALGAGRLRVLRQLLTESLVLAGVSAVLGLGLAYLGVRLLAWWNPESIPRVAGVTVDLRVLAFTAVVALLTSMLFSLAPALRAVAPRPHRLAQGRRPERFERRLTPAVPQRAGRRGNGARRRAAGRRRPDAAEPVVAPARPAGLDPTNVLTMRVALPQTSYPSTEQVVSFYQRMVERVRQLPGVRAAGAARSLPLGSTIGDFGLVVEGYVPPPGTRAKGDWQIVTDGYLEAMGERVVSGRGITAADSRTACSWR